MSSVVALGEHTTREEEKSEWYLDTFEGEAKKKSREEEQQKEGMVIFMNEWTAMIV